MADRVNQSNGRKCNFDSRNLTTRRSGEIVTMSYYRPLARLRADDVNVLHPFLPAHAHVPVDIRREHWSILWMRSVQLGSWDSIFQERIAPQISDAVGRERVVHQHVRVVAGGIAGLVGTPEGNSERRQRANVTGDEIGEDGIVHVRPPSSPYVEVVLTDLLVFGFGIHRLVLA